jgi:gliding motility-associated-like protein
LNKKKSTLFVLLFFVFIGEILHAQIQLTPSLISSGGGTGNIGIDFYISYSIGEPVIITSIATDSSIMLTQGFQQPYEKAIVSETKIITYNSFTPNGDQINDLWIIDFITGLPDNKVQIFNRWGNLLWEKANYDNINVVWDGKINNSLLPNGTYFYVIKSNNVTKKTGWVELSGNKN